VTTHHPQKSTDVYLISWMVIKKQKSDNALGNITCTTLVLITISLSWDQNIYVYCLIMKPKMTVWRTVLLNVFSTKNIFATTHQKIKMNDPFFYFFKMPFLFNYTFNHAICFKKKKVMNYSSPTAIIALGASLVISQSLLSRNPWTLHLSILLPCLKKA
jgi:hypothetical protein